MIMICVPSLTVALPLSVEAMTGTMLLNSWGAYGTALALLFGTLGVAGRFVLSWPSFFEGG